MTRRGRVDLLAFAVSIVVIGSAGLQLRAPSAVAQEASASRVRALLTRVGAASESYHATQMVAYYGEPQSNALLDVRSSPQGRHVRAGARHWSDDEAAGELVDLDARSVLEKYDVATAPVEELLGESLVPLTLTRRRDGRMAERWWIHEPSGVVYRRDLYDNNGGVVAMSTVIEMKWGDPGPSDPTETIVVPVREIFVSDAPDRLAGSYDLKATYALDVDGTGAEQWVYSDGLHALSVFRTPGGRRLPDGFAATTDRGVFVGPGPGTWAWEGAGQSWLVVAEEPSIDVAALVAPLPKGGPTLGSRLGSVWSRLFRLLT